MANPFKDYFTSKVEQLGSEMSTLNNDPSYFCIEDLIMKENNCCFEFGQVSVGVVEKPYCYPSIMISHQV
jgi:hypothetical protein